MTPDRRVSRAGTPDAALRQHPGSIEGSRSHQRSAPQPVHHRAFEGVARPRVDAQSGLEPGEAGPGPARRRVPRLSGRRAGRGEAAARSPRTGLSRLAAQCARPVSGRRRRLPFVSGAGAVPRCRQFRQGQGGDARGQPQFELDGDDGRRRARAGAEADAAGNQGTPGLRGSAEHRHSAQSPQQPGACGIRTASRARRRGPHRHSTARPAELGRGEENPRQDRDPGISHGRRGQQSAGGGRHRAVCRWAPSSTTRATSSRCC